MLMARIIQNEQNEVKKEVKQTNSCRDHESSSVQWPEGKWSDLVLISKTHRGSCRLWLCLSCAFRPSLALLWENSCKSTQLSDLIIKNPQTQIHKFSVLVWCHKSCQTVSETQTHTFHFSLSAACVQLTYTNLTFTVGKVNRSQRAQKPEDKMAEQRIVTCHFDQTELLHLKPAPTRTQTCDTSDNRTPGKLLSLSRNTPIKPQTVMFTVLFYVSYGLHKQDTKC